MNLRNYMSHFLFYIYLFLIPSIYNKKNFDDPSTRNKFLQPLLGCDLLLRTTGIECRNVKTNLRNISLNERILKMYLLRCKIICILSLFVNCLNSSELIFILFFFSLLMTKCTLSVGFSF